MILIVVAKISDFLKIASSHRLPLQNTKDKSELADSQKTIP
jgi:hypothetical protein